MCAVHLQRGPSKQIWQTLSQYLVLRIPSQTFISALHKTDSILVLVEENNLGSSSFRCQDSQSFVPMGLIEPDPQDFEL